jgi:hypothetical protein
VSENDLEHWLAKQPNRKPQAKTNWFEIDIDSLPVKLRTALNNFREARHRLVQSRKAFLKAIKPKQSEPKALGKRPRIKALLAKLYPEGVPDPAHCPRKGLQRKLLTLDPGLQPLDDDTLKKAVDEYNADPK